MNVKELAIALVRIPSVTDSSHEAKPLNIIRRELNRHHVSYQCIGKAPKQNLIAWIGSGNPVVVLNSHIDVVNAQAQMFLPRVSGGQLYGRGAADAKGPLAAMICAFLHFADYPIQGKLILCCVCDEENAGIFGSSVLAKRRIANASYIFGEPTNLHVIAAEKGFLRLKISVTGKEAHAAFPERGDNAIIRMACIISNLSKLSLPGSHPMLSRASISIGTISGGKKINVVAGACELGVDIRYLPSQNKRGIIQAVRAASGNHCVIEELDSGEPYEAKLSSPLVQAACLITKSVAQGVNYATDARFFSSCDAIVLGPGAPNVAHTDREHVSIAQLQKAVNIYIQIIDSCLRGC